MSVPPRCVTLAFDLDYTLWECYSECTRGPYRLVRPGTLADATGARLSLYMGVREMLEALAGGAVAEVGGARVELRVVAISRTCSPPNARRMLRAFGIEGLIERAIFDGGSKAPSVAALYREQRARCAKTGAVPAGVILFDDEYENIEDVSDLAARSAQPLRAVLLHHGVNLDIVLTAISDLFSHEFPP